MGQLINEAKVFINTNLDEALNKIKEKEMEDRLKSEVIDISLPGEKCPQGTLHPITETTIFWKISL